MLRGEVQLAFDAFKCTSDSIFISDYVLTTFEICTQRYCSVINLGYQDIGCSKNNFYLQRPCSSDTLESDFHGTRPIIFQLCKRKILVHNEHQKLKAEQRRM